MAGAASEAPAALLLFLAVPLWGTAPVVTRFLLDRAAQRITPAALAGLAVMIGQRRQGT